jgi:hypothetical protein
MTMTISECVKVSQKITPTVKRCEISCGGFDYLYTESDSGTIYIHLACKRPDGVAVSDWEAVAEAAIDRLDEVRNLLSGLLDAAKAERNAPDNPPLDPHDSFAPREPSQQPSVGRMPS